MTRQRQMQRGAAMVETVVRLTIVTAALVTMGVYLQRAMQGHRVSVSKSMGLQFDPQGTYTETLGRQNQDTVQLQRPYPMISANFQRPIAGNDQEDKSMTLDSLPTGPVPREPAFWGHSRATSQWGSTREASYDAPR